MQQESNISHGVKWGFIIGVVYTILLYIRYTTGVKNPMMLGIWTMTGYLIVLGLLLYSAFMLRKKVGGFIELKDAFKVLFVSVLIFELFYVVFTFIYMKYVNPDFYIELKDATEEMLKNNRTPQGQIDEMLGKMDAESASKMTIFDMMKSYLIAISISGLFALLFSFIVRKKRDPFTTPEDNFLQS